MKRKSSRRSSILKVTRPLEDIQNISSDDRALKKRRVSFANVVEIKEFPRNQQTHAPGTVLAVAPKALSFKAANEEDADTVIQISTPRGKKRRRISTESGSRLERLSIIPKLERSFCLTDEDFEVYEDVESASTLCKPEDITIKDFPVSSGFPLDEDDLGTYLSEVSMRDEKLDTAVASLSPVLKLESVSGGVSMEMTVQSSEQQKSTFSFLSAEDLLKVPPSRKLARFESEGASCPQRMDGICTQPLSDSSVSTSEGSNEQDPTCVENSCSESLPHSMSFLPNVTDQLELTCELTEDRDNLQSSKSLLLYSPKQVDLNCGESLSHSKSFLHNATDKLELTCCISKQNDVFLSPLSQSNPIRLDFTGGQTEREDSQSSNTVPSSDTDQLSFPSEEETRQALISSASSPNYLDLTCTQLEEKLDSITPFLSSCKVHSTDVQLCKEKQSEFCERSSRSDDCRNWLDNTVSPDTFLLEEDCSSPPPADVSFKDAPSVESSPSATSTASLISTRKSSSMKRFNLAGLQRLLEGKGKANMETPIIETPKALPIERGFPSRLEGSSCIAKCFVASDCPDREVNVSTIQDKSLLPSPSAYSKFCGILNCDQTVVDNSSVPCYSANTCTTGGKEAEQEVLNGVRFSDRLSLILARLTTIRESLRQRLNDTRYTDTHEAVSPALKILLNAVVQALCAIGVLISYGDLSGLSEAVLLHIDTLKPLSDVVGSSDDVTGSLNSKVKWISRMNALLKDHVYPMIEEAFGNARDIYLWEIGRWNKETIELTLFQDALVAFSLSSAKDLDMDVPVLEVASMNISSSNDFRTWIKPFEQCTSTSEMAKAIYDVHHLLGD